MRRQRLRAEALTVSIAAKCQAADYGYLLLQLMVGSPQERLVVVSYFSFGKFRSASVPTLIWKSPLKYSHYCEAPTGLWGTNV